jgi:hypothetical protein
MKTNAIFTLGLLLLGFSSVSAQNTWTEDNNDNRGLQLYNSGGTLGYGVRTPTGGGWAWQFTDLFGTPYFQVDYPTGDINMLNKGSILNLNQDGYVGFERFKYLGGFQRNGDVVNGNNYYTYLANGGYHPAGSDEKTFYIENRYVGFTGITLSPEGFRFLTLKGDGVSTGNQTVNEIMRISADGNVGMGTTNPGSFKLAVAGKIGAWGEVRVFTNDTPFPDYVFEPNYKLTPLTEIESYVKANKHLPEVPSANEIAKDGMSLNAMNVILLKKVEELTLHLINQSKQIEKLQADLKQLKDEKQK